MMHWTLNLASFFFFFGVPLAPAPHSHWCLFIVGSHGSPEIMPSLYEKVSLQNANPECLTDLEKHPE